MFVMLIVAGIFALLVLLTPHVNSTNHFPLPDEKGSLGLSWLEHQFATTNDLTLNNWISRNLMMNFNFHIGHHLFPRISSAYLPEITKVIQAYAVENQLGYRSYSLKTALVYHYQLIKNNAMGLVFFEEDM